MNLDERFVQQLLPLQGDLMALILAHQIPSHDADDVLQDAIIAMIRKYGEFRAGSNFRAWAFSILRNEILHTKRKYARNRIALSLHTLGDIEKHIERADPLLVEQTKYLHGCVDQLSEHSKQVFMMRYREHQDVSTISGRLRRSVGSLHTLLTRIRATLRKCIESAVQSEQRGVLP